MVWFSIFYLLRVFFDMRHLSAKGLTVVVFEALLIIGGIQGRVGLWSLVFFELLSEELKVSIELKIVLPGRILWSHEKTDVFEEVNEFSIFTKRFDWGRRWYIVLDRVSSESSITAWNQACILNRVKPTSWLIFVKLVGTWDVVHMMMIAQSVGSLNLLNEGSTPVERSAPSESVGWTIRTPPMVKGASSFSQSSFARGSSMSVNNDPWGWGFAATSCGHAHDTTSFGLVLSSRFYQTI